VKPSETRPGEFEVDFTPNFGGEPRETKTLATRESLEKFLSNLGVPEETQKRAIGDVAGRGTGFISGVLVSQAELEQNWSRVKE
jgi:hypothetical protein